MTTDTTTTTTKTSGHLLFGILAMACFAVALVGTAYLTRVPRDIPNAAAEEARIVCANFSGLDRFTVESQGAEAADDGTLHRYRITATCTSQHQVTGTIAIKG